MVNTVGRVLKSSEVKLEGKFQLQIDTDTTDPANSGSVNGSALQVNIVENTAEYAIIEVICSCGSKTRVKCQYNNQPAADQGQDQNNGEDNNAN
jgi:hypothetical protein